ncbi:hypothetical protein F5876DRAFT_51806, partial [Lentinula aff. lateritia]
LLSKTSESIWRIARENFVPGLPPLPMDLNQPQYACLFFDMSCYVRHFTVQPNIYSSGILEYRFVTIIGDATMCSGGSAYNAVLVIQKCMQPNQNLWICTCKQPFTFFRRFPMYSWELLLHLKPFPFKVVLPREKIKRTGLL